MWQLNHPIVPPIVVPPVWSWDSMGHCTLCHLTEYAVQRVQDMIDAGHGESKATHPTCNHVLVYREFRPWPVQR